MKPDTLVLPLCITALSTGVICACSALHYGHLPPETLPPPVISLTGIFYPERLFYLFGFSVSAIMFYYVAFLTHKKLLAPILEINYQSFNLATMWCAFVSATGLLVQAILPLQSNIVEVMRHNADLTFQSIIHQFCAGVFFLFAVIHTVALLILAKYFRNAPIRN